MIIKRLWYLVLPAMLIGGTELAAQQEEITAWRITGQEGYCLTFLGREIRDAMIIGRRSAILEAVQAGKIKGSCNLALLGPRDIETVLFEKSLSAADVPPGYGEGGAEDGVGIRFDDPEDFREMLSHARKAEGCKPVLEWCADSKGELSFSVGCDGLAQISVSTSGQVSLTVERPGGSTKVSVE